MSDFIDIPEDVNLVPDPVEPGTYVLEITKAEIKPNRDQTSTNLVVDAKVHSDKNGVEDIPSKNKGFRSWFSTKPDQLHRINRLKVACGMDKGGRLNPADLVGKKFLAEVRQEPYTDQNTKEQKLGAKLGEIYLPTV